MTQGETRAELVWDSRAGVAECPTWDAANNRVLFSDIPGRTIHALSLADGARRSWQLPEMVGSFGLCASGRLIVALRHRVVLFDPVTETIAELTPPVDEPSTNRLNDGKVAPDGSFWVGSMDENQPRAATAALYRVTPDGRIEKRAGGYMVSNGLAWSPDGAVLYHACTSQGFIDTWDHKAGAITNRRRFATLTDAEGRPDGGAMDMQGHYWSAGVSAGCLNRFAPDGRLTEKLAMPVPNPTMPCFAPGALYVTSLRRAGNEALYPEAGGLFRLPTSHAGAPIARFNDL